MIRAVTVMVMALFMWPKQVNGTILKKDDNYLKTLLSVSRLYK